MPLYKIPESVLVVIHDAALNVLMIERTAQPGFWQGVTGSKDEPGESWSDTAAREVFEETGIAIGSAAVPVSCLRDWGMENIYEIYPFWRHRYAPGVVHNTERVFGLQVPEGTPVKLSPREHMNHRWLPWTAAAELCFSPSNAEAVRQVPRFAGPISKALTACAESPLNDSVTTVRWPASDRPIRPTTA